MFRLFYTIICPILQQPDGHDDKTFNDNYRVGAPLIGESGLIIIAL